MNASRSTRRARRGTLVRSAGWLAAASMLATAVLAPATVSAADPKPMDVACNNIVHGGRSPEFVWTTVGTAGVTANWATDADHFDAATADTVTVRVCVVDADGDDHGGIDQNTENDGAQLFPWSVLGYDADPCPDDTLSFASSVDSRTVQTKKSDFVACPDAGGDEPTDSTDQPSDGADQPSDGADQPSDGADQPSDGADEPSDGADEPSDGADEPSDGADEPSDGADEPSDGADDPSGGIDEPTDAVNEPTGAVEGAVGTPGLTPPPTDTAAVAAPSVPSSDGWRIVLAFVAFTLIASLTFSSPRGARRRV
ncbi:MAG TPA: hypothetical protein VFJ71_02015 [Candidatus Limnocylindrales bacterium]|nr:hypothetical protein [Candidatus Limnocylindrales bacterium]